VWARKPASPGSDTLDFGMLMLTGDEVD
jgi:hypothetical protein